MHLKSLAREHTRYKVAIGFSFEADWLRKWREVFTPITVKGQENKFWDVLDTQLKSAPSHTNLLFLRESKIYFDFRNGSRANLLLTIH